MKNSFGIVVTLLIGIALTFSGMSDADARRLGGGGSFGGKSLFGSPYKRSTAAPVRTARQQQAIQHNQAAKQSWAQRGGFMGMLGGLAIGGLLGSLLFGGAFENLNFMDLLIFGGIAYMLYRFLGARAGASTLRPAYNPVQPPPSAERAQISSGGFDTQGWFRGDQAGAAPWDQTLQPVAQSSAAVPAGFGEQAFIAGARIAYRDLQKAWDENDLAAIEALTTASMFTQIQDRIGTLEVNNRTEVLKLDTELLEVREIDGMLEAVVLFDAVMREEVKAQARQVREVWHFTKPTSSQQPKWYLDGIQQLAD